MDKANSKENFLIRYSTSIAIIAVTLLVLSASLMFLKQTASSAKSKGWVVHTYDVIMHIELLFGKLKDVQIGVRSYIITGNEDYLDNYEDALRDNSTINTGINAIQEHHSIAQEIKILRDLTSDNPAQQSNLDEMEVVVKKFLEYDAEVISQRKKMGNNADKTKFDLTRGRDLMQKIRELMRLMEVEESHLLSLRTEVDEANTERNNNIMLYSIAVFYILMVFSIFLYQRNRANARAQLLIYTAELEKREEELKIQQEELQASNEELEESSKALEEQNLRIQQQSEELEESQHLIEEKINELETANKYKSEFLANISHELRTPLNSLLILAKSLSDNEEGNLTEEQKEEANVIYNGGLELLNLINDILDLSKVEAGKISISPADVSLQDVGRYLYKQFEPIVNESKVAFNIDIADYLEDNIYTDDQRLEQILKNLLSNAFKFTENGSVTLKVYRPTKEITFKRNGLYNENCIAFSVIDTGIGIADNKLQDIFEAFQQEDGSTDRHYGGTGLGLTISRKFAHLLGGEIHVQSKKGIGSTFTLYLPSRIPDSADIATQPARKKETRVSKATSQKKTSSTAKSASLSQRRLLIIEDDKDFANILGKQAEAHGYKPVIVYDGKAGLLSIARQEVDAIILDLRLPDIDGISILEQLKSDTRMRHIPVHVITGHADNDNKEILRKGAIGCLIKPVSAEDLESVFAKIEPLLGDAIKTVLVIEDDTSTQTAIKKLLNKKDLQITTASRGDKAFNELDKRKFDCIILDLLLPDMSGFEWLQKFEEQSNGEALPPVVIYTSKDLSEEENRKLNQYTGSIVIKGANSSERLLDEVTLFLHSIESTLSEEQKKIIRMQHNPDKVLKGKKILLTDDDLRNTFALSKLLKKHGMEVVIADNGEMALEKLESDKTIDLILMDIMMPVMDGYQAIDEIRKRSNIKHLPIIALTARAMPEEQERCINAGANDYLTKPVDIEKLLTLMRVLLFKQEKAA